MDIRNRSASLGRDMVDNKYDIVGIGNSIVDVITDVEDQFLNDHE